MGSGEHVLEGPRKRSVLKSDSADNRPSQPLDRMSQTRKLGELLLNATENGAEPAANGPRQERTFRCPGLAVPAWDRARTEGLLEP